MGYRKQYQKLKNPANQKFAGFFWCQNIILFTKSQ